MFLSLFFLFSSIGFLIFYSIHYVYVLLIIEYFLLGGFVLIGFLGTGNYGLSGLFFYILLVVCMGGFSISLLISLSRFYGGDFWLLGYVF